MQFVAAVREFVVVVQPDVGAAAIWNYIVPDGVAAIVGLHNAGYYADYYNRDLGAVAPIVFVDYNDLSVVDFHVRVAAAASPRFAVFAVVAVFARAAVPDHAAAVQNAVDVPALAELFVVHVVAAKLDVADFVLNVVARVADVFVVGLVDCVIVGFADAAARVAVARPVAVVRVTVVVPVVPADFAVVVIDVVLCAVDVPDFEIRSVSFVDGLLSLFFSEHVQIHLFPAM